jgi:hypothetical protein
MCNSIGRIIFGITLLSAISIGWLLVAHSQPGDEIASEFAPGKFVSSQICGACHQHIYRAWSEQSIHAKAVTDPVFQAGYREAIRAYGENVREKCNVCHAPTTLITGDNALTTQLSQEGVTCDFCHSVKEVQLTPVAPSKSPFVLDVGLVKRGPFADAKPRIHQSAYSKLHTDSLFCASCHEHTNDKGVQVLSTYSEWKESPYPNQRFVCQTCHMQVYFRDIVIDPVSQKLTHKLINLHSVPGGHSVNQLQKALSVEITDIVRAPDRMIVNIRVVNQGAGHAAPTGLSTKKMVLQVDVAPADGGQSYHEEQVYQRVLADENGEILDSEAELFMAAARVRKDTRLKPGESRLEKFTFPITPGGKVHVSARLVYVATHGEYHPEEVQEVYFIEKTSE